MSKVLYKIILDTRRALKDGTFPVKLRITYQGKRLYFPTDYSYTKEDFGKVEGASDRSKYKPYLDQLKDYEDRAKIIIKEISPFSFIEFERKWNDYTPTNDLFISFDHLITEYASEGRAGTASSYSNARNSLLAFIKNEPPVSQKGRTLKEIWAIREHQKKTPAVPFQVVTADFLKDYEKWMVKHGRSLTTVGMYVRPLRTIINNAIEQGIVKKEEYPFGKKKYKIPSSRNIKKAISKTEIKLIEDYAPESAAELFARDLWLFSYYCNGMNLKDIANLKYENIGEQSITFYRGKTINTTRENLKPISAHLSDKANLIITRHGTKPITPYIYVFPIYTPKMDATERLEASRRTIKQINKYVKRIAAKVGIDKNITSYVARHSFSTIVTNAGLPTKVLSDLLGHNSEKTTRSYQGTLPIESLKMISDLLSDPDS